MTGDLARIVGDIKDQWQVASLLGQVVDYIVVAEEDFELMRAEAGGDGKVLMYQHGVARARVLKVTPGKCILVTYDGVDVPRSD